MLPCPSFSLVTLTYVTLVAAQSAVLQYAPSTMVQCPDVSTQPLLRVFTPQSQAIHPLEMDYIQSKESNVLPNAWTAWIGNASQIGYNSPEFGGNYSKIGMAISGGGYRVAQYGAGVISALDARNDSARAAGTGGLYQVTSYLSGLSGGSWLVVSLALNDWPTTSDLVYGNGGNLSGWLLDLDLVTPDGFDVFDSNNQAYYGSVLSSVLAKAAKGIDTSIIDPWSRLLSYHFLSGTSPQNFFTNDSSHGAGQLWSQATMTPSYQQAIAPFPVIVTNSLPIGSNLTIPSISQTVYEMTPLEFGSYDPNLSAMVNMTFAGTNLTNGNPDNGSSCVTGFDQAGFVMGASSALFRPSLDSAETTLEGFSSGDTNGILFMLDQLLKNVVTRGGDVANWPNPFHSVASSTFTESDSSWLELVDGGSNGAQIPIDPLLVKARGLDTIVIVDGSSEEPSHWPNGTSMLFSAQRLSTVLAASHQQLPPLPESVGSFISAGVNQRPTLFGCDPDTPEEYPLVIYLPNSPPLTGDNPSTNYDTFQFAYTDKETQIFLDQAHNNTIGGFTPNSNAPDPNWGKCLQCAAVDRARLKQNVTSRSSMCQECFSQYCYDPLNPPSSSELPNRKFTLVDPDPQGLLQITTFLSANKASIIGGVLGLVMALGILTGILYRQQQRKEVRYKLVSQYRKNDPVWEGYEEFELSGRDVQ
ncbi:hypothetical protein PILCRDRAFT_819610 [Piloderma croceum F 1598]|uniref:Lysophospholipase n=1 Tax=Piloderma croceum (strain F 1598) TaxID=765440 RepID=A0A0C3FYN8_PILCF|nr:hypothetical protein PILCRDRAFT_819610 [Piloderma croceum F 1598]